ncbi:MAG: putative secreted protein [Frankiales bacterium]|nr:putative secreted protein [Frankiales bacterium]
MMRRTGLADLLVSFLALGVISYLLLRMTYSSIPPFQWFIALPIAVLAGVEFVIARRVRQAVRHLPGSRPLTAFAVARGVALGKATAMVGSALTGAGVALILKVLPDSDRTSAASHDLRVGVAFAVVSAILCASGIVLERAGIDPNRDRDAAKRDRV